MDDTKEQVRYGFSLWPFATLAMLGVFVNSFGPGFYQSLLSGAQGLPLFQVILVLGVLLIQLAGGIIAGAGFFGGLYKVIKDAKE
jgi:hypothetical protein